MAYIGNTPGEILVPAAGLVKSDGSVLQNASASDVVSTMGDTAFSFRNKIIGGDFTTNPWQRGTSFTGLVSPAYTADRWSAQFISDGVVDILKTADAPTATQSGVHTQHCLHADVTTADASIAASQYYSIRYIPEGFDVASFGCGQSGTRYITLSFWVKSTKTGTFCVSFINSANDRGYVAEYTVSVSDTWEKKTITIPVDTSGTWLYDSGRGMVIRWMLAAGTSLQGTGATWGTAIYATANQVNALDSTANNFKIALVQLEAGSVATPFESRPYGTELALCQRYCIGLSHFSNATNGAIAHACPCQSNAIDAELKFPVEMRSAPTLSIGNISTWATAVPTSGQASAFDWTAAAYVTISGSLSFSLQSASTSAASLRPTASTSFSAGAGKVVRLQLDPANTGFLSAEL